MRTVTPEEVINLLPEDSIEKGIVLELREMEVDSKEEEMKVSESTEGESRNETEEYVEQFLNLDEITQHYGELVKATCKMQNVSDYFIDEFMNTHI